MGEKSLAAHNFYKFIICRCLVKKKFACMLIKIIYKEDGVLKSYDLLFKYAMFILSYALCA